MLLAKTPRLVSIHWSKAALNKAGSRKSASRLSLSFTWKMLGMRTWSERFFAMDEFSPIIEIPRTCGSSLAPIYERRRPWGVPIELTERWTSLLAVTMADGALQNKEHQLLPWTIWESSSSPTGLLINSTERNEDTPWRFLYAIVLHDRIGVDVRPVDGSREIDVCGATTVPISDICLDPTDAQHVPTTHILV